MDMNWGEMPQMPGNLTCASNSEAIYSWIQASFESLGMANDAQRGRSQFQTSYLASFTL